MHRIALFIISFIMWLLLVWPFDGGGRLQGHDFLLGAAVALVVALAMKDITTRRFSRWLNPVRWFWFLVYVAVLVFNIARANFDVAYRVLHPAMPIRPGVVRVRTRLKTATAIAALANSITLTPGTHVVDAEADGVLYVHWINVKTMDEVEAGRIIVGRFEWVIRRIFE